MVKEGITWTEFREQYNNVANFHMPDIGAEKLLGHLSDKQLEEFIGAMDFVDKITGLTSRQTFYLSWARRISSIRKERKVMCNE